MYLIQQTQRQEIITLELEAEVALYQQVLVLESIQQIQQVVVEMVEQVLECQMLLELQDKIVDQIIILLVEAAVEFTHQIQLQIQAEQVV